MKISWMPLLGMIALKTLPIFAAQEEKPCSKPGSFELYGDFLW